MGVASRCARQSPQQPNKDLSRRRRPNPTRQAWVSEAKRNVSRKTPRYLVNVESKIKDQLNAHRARLKRERAAGRDALGDSSNTPRAVDIADAFLRSEAPQWDSTIDDAALDDYGLPADDQPVPDYQPPRRKEGERPDYSSWVGDYGPVNAKGEKPMPPADGDEAARDLAAPADVDAALQAAAAAPAETAEEADDDALDGLPPGAGGRRRGTAVAGGDAVSTTEPAVPRAPRRKRPGV